MSSFSNSIVREFRRSGRFKVKIVICGDGFSTSTTGISRSEEHTSELQSQSNLVCRLLLEKKKKTRITNLANYLLRVHHFVFSAHHAIRKVSLGLHLRVLLDGDFFDSSPTCTYAYSARFFS